MIKVFIGKVVHSKTKSLSSQNGESHHHN